jgi:hypothetical protein
MGTIHFTPLDQKVETKKINFTPTGNISDIIQEHNVQQDKQQSLWEKAKGVGKTVGNILTSSEQAFGQDIAAAGSQILPESWTGVKTLKEAQATKQQTINNLLNKVREEKQNGRDPKRYLDLLSQQTGQPIPTVEDLYPALKKSNTQVIGDAAGVLLDILSVGSYGNAAKGAKTGKLLSKAPSVVTPVVDVAKKTAGDYLKNVGKKVVVGAGTGYAYDVAGNLQSGKEGTDVLKPGMGAVIGGGIPLAVEAAKGVGFIAKQVAKYTASGLSGTPVKAIEEAFQNPDSVQEAIRRAAQDTDGTGQKIYQNATEALDNLKQARSDAYEQGLAKLEKEATYTKGGKLYVDRVLTDAEAKATKGYIPGTKISVPTNLTTSGIKNVFTTTVKEFGAEGGGKGGINYTNVALDDAHISKLEKLQERIYNWTDKTPTGMNRLNQVIESYKLGGVNLGSSEKKFNYIVGNLKTNLSNYVGERIPQIAEMNKGYAASSEVIDNIVNQLKLGKGDPNTALRKLLNVFNPKSTVYRPVVEQLGEKGARDLMSDIAGLTMSSWTPEGLAKYFDLSGATALSILNPTALVAAPLASPRIIGKVTTGLGKIAKNKTVQNIAGTVYKAGKLSEKLIRRQAGLNK